MSAITHLCDGCQRTLDEIARWSGMTPTEQLAVLGRVDQRRAAAATTTATHQSRP